MRKKPEIKLAIGLPVFQGERYLALALDSILHQSFGDFEVIISDNHSTDATEEVSRDYAKRDKRIRYVRNESNLGVARNFNQAFHLSRSAYFRWAAYDDILEPTYLQRCVEILDADQAAAVAHSHVWRIDADGKRLGPMPEQRLTASLRAATRFEGVVRYGEYNAIWGVMRSAAVRRTRMHGSYRSSDYVFLAELAVQGRFAIAPEYLFNLREHDGQYTGNHWSPETQAQWWGTQTAGWKYTEAPLVYTQQFIAAMQSQMSWDQKVVCYRIVADCVARLGSAIAGRWVTRLAKHGHPPVEATTKRSASLSARPSEVVEKRPLHAATE